MPATPTYILLNQITLGASASDVTFSNIPQNYGDLIIVIAGTASGDNNFAVYFNNDTTATNYNFVNAGDFGSYSGNSSEGGEIGSSQSINTLQVFDYSQIDKHKTVLYRRNNTVRVGMGATRWANTSAINSIKIQMNSGTISSGTVLSLYGVYA